MNTLEDNHARSRADTHNKSAASDDQQVHLHDSPVLRLLPEILVIIFSFHAEANPVEEDVGHEDVFFGGMTRAQFRLGWITVTHVCSLWRRVALDHSCLWTDQRFNLGLKWTAEMLCRAGSAPLNLTFSEEFVPFPPSKDDAATVISKLLHRVSTLIVKEGAFKPAVLDALTLPAPLVSSLRMSSASGKLVILPRSLFADSDPKLRHLFLCNILPIWTAPVLTGLKSMCLKINCHADVGDIPSYTDLFDALRAMPGLEALELGGCLPLGAFPHSLKEQKVELPNLWQLVLHGHAPGFHQILEHLDFPAEAIVRGTCLTDDMTGKECCDVLPLLLSYLPRPSLETLEVSWKSRFDRTFFIKGYSTSHEDENSGKPCFLLRGSRRLSIAFQFKFLLWSASAETWIWGERRGLEHLEDTRSYATSAFALSRLFTPSFHSSAERASTRTSYP
ncbi:hypothetical protein BJV78DRAFT_1233838 [Lactifluus subvellereus]|nr:hypothetical protein BJV78DRAFT_1233838 [Lactifluus subvellereus]